LFAGKEESVILQLASNRDGFAFPPDLDFERLSRASFAMPEVHRRREAVPAGNKDFVVTAHKAFHSNLSNSAHKLAHIARLSDWFNAAELKVVFMKGAAEVSLLKDSVEYLGRRYMSDVDALCPVDQLHEVDTLLAKQGYELFSIDAPSNDRKEIIEYCVSNHSHVVYEAFKMNHLEIHPYVAADWNSDSYPNAFSELILNEAQQIEVSGSRVWVPRFEHLLVQFFCHAAAKKDHEELFYPNKVSFDRFCGDLPPSSVRVNARLDAHQLQFLLRARWLLTELKSRFEIDSTLVASLLSQVPDAQRLEMYLDLAAYYLPDLMPIERQTTFEKLCEQRRQLVVEWSLPSVAAEIERILEKEISNKVEELRASFEDRMSQVEEHAQQSVENFKQLQLFQQQVAENFEQLQLFQQQVAERFGHIENRLAHKNRFRPELQQPTVLPNENLVSKPLSD